MTMSDEAKKAKAEYMRKYRKENPEKVKKHLNDYWERQGKKYKEEGQEVMNKTS